MNSLMQGGKLPDLDIDIYLRRIKCKRKITLSLRYLRTLHVAHLMYIPFENLDIHMGNEIILDIRKIGRKIMPSNRGGFCYELNGLFYHLLISLGYQCHLISGQVYDKEGNLGLELGHVAILLQFENKEYLVDVGFGSSFLSPILLETGKIQMDFNQFFKIDKTIDDEYILKCSQDSFDYESKYLFTKKKRQFVEFIDMCHYQQTNKKSTFTKKKMITRILRDGRITLTDSKLVITKAGQKKEQILLNHDEFKAKLLQHFGIRYVHNRN